MKPKITVETGTPRTILAGIQLKQNIRGLNLKKSVKRNDVPYSLIKRDLVDAKKAKKAHKRTCTANGCTRCHFYSGSISALSKLTGRPGVID